MKVQGFYTKDVVVAEPAETMSHAVTRMAEHQVGSLVVLDRGNLVGILTERDVMRAIADGQQPKSTRISEYMTPDPATGELDEDSERIVERMLKLAIRHMPIVDGGASSESCRPETSSCSRRGRRVTTVGVYSKALHPSLQGARERLDSVRGSVRPQDLTG